MVEFQEDLVVLVEELDLVVDLEVLQHPNQFLPHTLLMEIPVAYMVVTTVEERELLDKEVSDMVEHFLNFLPQLLPQFFLLLFNPHGLPFMV
jgi:hypothetical protein